MLASSDNTLEDNYINVGNEKLLKATAIYGANASGKSNLFKTLAIIGSIIRQSNFNNPNVMLPIIPFKLDKETINKPSEFEIKFLVDEAQAKAKLMSTKVGQNMSPDQRNDYLRPFVLTDALKAQMMNLV